MRVEELERELRAERPEVEPDFARRLDEWAARGFPRGGELDPRRGRNSAQPPWRRTWDRLRTIPSRRLIVPAGAAAGLVAAVVIGLNVASDDFSQQLERPASDLATQQSVPETGAPADSERSAAGAAAQVDAERVRPARRKIAQTIDLSLATTPDDFRDAADEVLDVVGEHRGFVVSSSVAGGDPDVEGAQLGRATFQLRIPASRVQAAVGALSDLGHVVSRTDGTKDITGRFTSANRRIDAYTNARARLLERLENATTTSEQESIRRQLRIVEAQLADAERVLGNARERVRLVPVAVAIAADRSVSGGGSDDWDLGEALDDAGGVLEIALGVALISAAVLLPIALIAIVALIASRGVARRQRERALDEPER